VHCVAVAQQLIAVKTVPAAEGNMYRRERQPGQPQSTCAVRVNPARIGRIIHSGLE